MRAFCVHRYPTSHFGGRVRSIHLWDRLPACQVERNVIKNPNPKREIETCPTILLEMSHSSKSIPYRSPKGGRRGYRIAPRCGSNMLQEEYKREENERAQALFKDPRIRGWSQGGRNTHFVKREIANLRFFRISTCSK